MREFLREDTPAEVAQLLGQTAISNARATTSRLRLPSSGGAARRSCVAFCPDQRCLSNRERRSGTAMAQITFTQHLTAHVPCPSLAVSGATVREALDHYFALHPRVRGYVLDDQGALRKHVVIFIDGQQLKDRAGLSEPVCAGTSLYVMQALSGG